MLTICDDSDPLQIAGSARIDVNWLMQPFRRLISSATWSIPALIIHSQLDPAFLDREHLPRYSFRNSSGGTKHGVLQNPANNYAWMGSQHVHDYVGADFPQVVGANNGIPRIVYQIESRLVFDQIAHSFAIFECPLHVCDRSGAHIICGAGRIEHVSPHF